MAKKMVYQVQDRDWELLPIFVYKNGFNEYEVMYYDNDMDNKMFIGVFKTFELAKELADNLGYIYVQACNYGVRELY